MYYSAGTMKKEEHIVTNLDDCFTNNDYIAYYSRQLAAAVNEEQALQYQVQAVSDNIDYFERMLLIYKGKEDGRVT
jgi:hypothetical protein